MHPIDILDFLMKYENKIVSIFESEVKKNFLCYWDRQGTSYPPQADTVYDGAAVPIAKEDMGWGHAPSR